MTKTDLIFLAFSSRFVDFVDQFCFRCKFSFNKERRSSQVPSLTVARFFSTNHNSLLRISTNEIASFCIHHISRQMPFSICCKGGAKAGQNGRLSLYVEIFWNAPLSHGGHIGYDVCTLGMKSRRCVSNLRFAALNHAKQRSFQCALMCPCAQITDQKVH